MSNFNVGDRVRVNRTVSSMVVFYPLGTTGTVAWARRYDSFINESPGGLLHVGVAIDPEHEEACTYEAGEDGCAWFGGHVDAPLDALELA